VKSKMCIGIAASTDRLAVAALETDHAAVVSSFPSGDIGIAVIKGFLTAHDAPVRLAVAGAAALNLALVLGNVAGRETFIVSSTVADQPVALAQFAWRTP
jgi:hypothetical protein